MLATHLTKLYGNDLPDNAGPHGDIGQPASDALPGLPETIELVDGFDGGLVHGFARASGGFAAALKAMADALVATPLGDRMAEAADKVVSGSLADDHLAALAGARTALFGAVHDALLARFDSAIGRARSLWDPLDSWNSMEAPEGETIDTPTNLLAGVRSWLGELAIAGWRGVNHDSVSASTQILQAVLAEPGLRRLAVLLDGLASELQACSPVSTMDQVPARRWADLWTRAQLLCQPGGVAIGRAAEVSGRLLPLGIDVHEHGTAVRFQVHALLEPAAGGPVRQVRASVTASKVDTIVGAEVWKLVRGCPVLLMALAAHRALTITDMPLLPSGDLLWRDDRAEMDEPADPFATARLLLGDALAPAVPPLDRHPARIAEPVHVEGYSVSTDDATGAITFDLGGPTVAVAVDRLPSAGPLTRDLVASSSTCVGLLRWDAWRWRLQPLAVLATVKRKTIAVHTADWARGPTGAKATKSAAAAGDAVTVLRERAGRLLRRGASR